MNDITLLPNLLRSYRFMVETKSPDLNCKLAFIHSVAIEFVKKELVILIYATEKDFWELPLELVNELAESNALYLKLVDGTSGPLHTILIGGLCKREHKLELSYEDNEILKTKLVFQFNYFQYLGRGKI